MLAITNSYIDYRWEGNTTRSQKFRTKSHMWFDKKQKPPEKHLLRRHNEIKLDNRGESVSGLSSLDIALGHPRHHASQTLAGLLNRMLLIRL